MLGGELVCLEGISALVRHNAFNGSIVTNWYATTVCRYEPMSRSTPGPPYKRPTPGACNPTVLWSRSPKPQVVRRGTVCHKLKQDLGLEIGQMPFVKRTFPALDLQL